MVDQYLALTIIGVIVLVIGIILLMAKIRSSGILILIGILWLFTMGLYYGLSATGIYGKPHILNNVIGILILVIGGSLAIYYLSKSVKKGGR